MQRDWRDSTERALEVFAEELNGQPEAKKAFEALRMELLRAAEASRMKKNLTELRGATEFNGRQAEIG